MNLEAQLEGVLFYRAEPVALAELATITNADSGEVSLALMQLRTSLAPRGIVLIEKEDLYELATAPELSAIIESLRKEELRRDIGKAGAETLAIILYNDMASRAEIDHIRGVNSTFILRNLMIRGLIERMQNPKDQRSFVYKPTMALFAHLGITRKEELPNYQEMVGAIQTYRDEQRDEAVMSENV